jgi:hypothetical protein
MSDTSPEMQRLHIAAGMFDTVRAVILSSCPADASADTRREHLRRRLYPELDLPIDHSPGSGAHSI